MSLSNPKLKNAETRATYQRNRHIQTRNPLCKEHISEKCKMCDGRGRKKQFHSLNKLYGHYLSHHKLTQGIFESNKEFEIRKQQSFDYKQYILSLAECLFMEKT